MQHMPYNQLPLYQNQMHSKLQDDKYHLQGHYAYKQEFLT